LHGECGDYEDCEGDEGRGLVKENEEGIAKLIFCFYFTASFF